MRSSIIILCVISVSFIMANCYGNMLDCPQVSADGKYIAFSYYKRRAPSAVDKTPGKKSSTSIPYVGVYSYEDKSLKRYPIPDNMLITGMMWAGRKLVVESCPFSEYMADPVLDNTSLKEVTVNFNYRVLDTVSGKFSKSEYNIKIKRGVIGELRQPEPVVGTFKNRSCVYFPMKDQQKTKVLDLDNLTVELGELDFHALHAGNGWMVKYAYKELTRGEAFGAKDKGKGFVLCKDLVCIEIYGPDAKKVSEINYADMDKRGLGHTSTPNRIFVAAEEGRVLLVCKSQDSMFFDNRFSPPYYFKVHDLKTGKLLWRGSANPIKGIPAIFSDCIYSIDRKKEREIDGTDIDKNPIVIRKHSKKTKEIIADIPLRKGDVLWKYSYNKKRNEFVLYIAGKNRRLLLIPLKKDLKPADITEVNLKTTEAKSK